MVYLRAGALEVSPDDETQNVPPDVDSPCGS